MVEAFAILAVVIVALGAVLSARFLPNTLWQNSAQKLSQLEAYRSQLNERLDRGRREAWDPVMMAQIEHRLAEVDAQLQAASGK